MAKKNSKLKLDILSTILVLIVTTAFLSYVNINNNKDGVDIDATEISNTPALLQGRFQNQAFVFQNDKELKAVFPTIQEKIDFEKYIVGAYIGSAQANPGYDIKMTNTSRQNDVIKVTYKLEDPDKDKIYSDVIAYPVVMVKINRTGLAAVTTHTLNFVDQDSFETTGTKFDLHEN